MTLMRWPVRWPRILERWQSDGDGPGVETSIRMIQLALRRKVFGAGLSIFQWMRGEDWAGLD
jgi:hypothetical protein